jgi:pSer/pThr/pTyr-binding forkhead associated (FHA) protein
VVSLRSTDASTVRWEDRSERPWISLEHVLPPDFAGVERLDKEVAIVGRSLECDVRLYSASASRQHARIEQREDGWYLAPIEGRRVMVDGQIVEDEIELQTGMRLSFGDDELLVVDQEDPQPREDSRKTRWQVVVPVVLAGAASLLVLLWLLGML